MCTISRHMIGFMCSDGYGYQDQGDGAMERCRGDGESGSLANCTTGMHQQQCAIAASSSNSSDTIFPIFPDFLPFFSIFFHSSCSFSVPGCLVIHSGCVNRKESSIILTFLLHSCATCCEHGPDVMCHVGRALPR